MPGKKVNMRADQSHAKQKHSNVHGALNFSSLRKLNFEFLESRWMLAVIDFPLTNAGFESPELDINDSWHPTVDGWNVSGFPGITFEIPTVETSPAPEGEQYLYGNSDNWTISQSGPTIAANTRYILSIDVFALTTGPSSASLSFRDSAFFTLEDVDFNDLPEGEWTTIKIGWNSTEFINAIGKDLTVIIGGSRIAVDNVKLTVDDSVHDFYISSSSGSNSNDGFSAGSAFLDFSSLAPYFPLLPGERLLLKAGDVFTEELNIRGKGVDGSPIELTSYGVGANPIIRRQDIANDIGVVWNNASYVNISNIDVEHSKLGIYLRYEWTDVGSKNVTIENSNFRDMTDPTLDAAAHNFEFAWSDAIFVGGQAWNQAEFSTRLENLTIRNVTAENVAHLFGTAWYFPAVYYSRLKNLIIEDSVAINALAGAFQLFNVDGGHIKRVHSITGGGQDTWSGTTLGFIQSSQNFLIEDNVFAYIDRAQSADGSGMDFEGDSHNITFRNNVIHNNAGSALLILSTGGPNTNLVIEDNTFYNNARDPWIDEINSEIQGSNASHTGIIRNNGIYRGSTDINFFSPNSDWSGFTITGNRQDEYANVSQRPTWWDFDTDGDFEGWSGFNQWNNAAVTGGALTGESGGIDPYVQSPPTWIDTNEQVYAWIRMSQTQGSTAQLFYITEDDPVWDPTKSIFFSITSDGNMQDYFIDLTAPITTKGVITQIRLDPTIVGGSDMAIDFVRLTDSTDLNQVPASDPLAAPQEMTFTSIASEDGYILESSQDSGTGNIVNSSSSTFLLGDTSSNAAYRQFLSFDTSSLPDNASIVEATLGITRVGNPTGDIPIGVADSEFGDILVDIATPAFGTEQLTATDWESSATKLGVSKFAWPAYLDGMTIYSRLENPDNDLINLTGKTQYRIRYQNDDDGDNVADYMSYATGSYGNVDYRPTLTIKYYINDNPSADFDSDGDQDGADFLVWARNFGSYGTALNSDGDANTDTDVDDDDLLVWQEQFGQSTVAVAAATALPYQEDPEELIAEEETQIEVLPEKLSELVLAISDIPRSAELQSNVSPTSLDTASIAAWRDNQANTTYVAETEDSEASPSPYELIDDSFAELESAESNQPLFGDIDDSLDAIAREDESEAAVDPIAEWLELKEEGDFS